MQTTVRIGFVLNSGGTHWTGGVNYMTNLLRAIGTSSRLQPIVFSREKQLSPEFSEFSNLEFHHTAWVDPESRHYIFRKSLSRALGRDLVFERFLKKHNIDILSHYGHLGRRSSVPTIAWIPDFQHLHMPEFFSAKDQKKRNSMYARIANGASIVVLSSESAQQDFKVAFPHSATRSRVLRFVSDVGVSINEVPPRSFVETKYGLKKPYFHIPNQFWIHKNHGVVIEALKLARQQGRPLTIVATGNTKDARHPDYFEKLMQRVQSVGCVEDFKVLGMVPYQSLTALMVHAVALINPSRFEGWSTTVEEAKSLGKRIILSDIPVHREQSPEYGFFFNPDDPEGLMEAMQTHFDTFEQSIDLARQSTAKHLLPARFKAFGAVYEDIAMTLIQDLTKYRRHGGGKHPRP